MRRTWKLGLQLLVMWSFPALFFASQAWFAMAGGGQQAAPVTLLVGTLASWYLWAAATPLVLHLVERWPSIATLHRVHVHVPRVPPPLLAQGRRRPVGRALGLGGQGGRAPQHNL